MAVVGFVGAGQMGAPMVRRLLAAGTPVRMYARRPEIRAEFTAAGATVVDSPREAAEGSDVVLACLFSDPQLLEVCEGPDGVLAGLAPGAVLASHTTGSTRTVELLAGAAERSGAHVVDAPVSGTATDIAEGNLTVLVGGPRPLVDRIQQAVAPYAATVLGTGPLGSALSIKLVNNLLFAANCQLAESAAALGEGLGVDRRQLFAAIATCSGRSYAASTVGLFPAGEQFVAAAGSFLAKDVQVCQDELAAAGHDAGLLAAVVHGGPLPLGSRA